MKKVLIVTLVVMVALSALSLTAFAAGGRGSDTGTGARQPIGEGQGPAYGFVDEDGDGVNDRSADGCAFVDEDGDGACDLMVDEDGDGVCDNQRQFANEGQGQMGQGQRGEGTCDEMVDENGDGICDNASSSQTRQGKGGRGRP